MQRRKTLVSLANSPFLTARGWPLSVPSHSLQMFPLENHRACLPLYSKRANKNCVLLASRAAGSVSSSVLRLGLATEVSRGEVEFNDSEESENAEE